LESMEPRIFNGVTKGLDATFSFYGFLRTPDSLQITEQKMANKDACLLKDTQWAPLNMPGQERSTEDSVDHCQNRCKRTSGCAHFTFWGDGGCHIQDNRGMSRCCEQFARN
jgi:hypothetical protein